MPDGTSGRVLAEVRAGRLEVVGSWELAAELLDVLGRRKLRRYSASEEDVTAILAMVGHTLPTVDFDVEVRDPKDAPVVAAAVAGRAEAIVTGDRHLLDDAALLDWLAERGIAVRTPATLLDELR